MGRYYETCQSHVEPWYSAMVTELTLRSTNPLRDAPGNHDHKVIPYLATRKEKKNIVNIIVYLLSVNPGYQKTIDQFTGHPCSVGCSPCVPFSQDGAVGAN